MTTLRSHFDSWLAGKATGAGARLLTSTVATGLVRDADGRVVGVRTDRDGAELRAKVVIACDGVNSFLAKEAGMMARAEASHHTLGVKEVLEHRRRSRSTSASGSGGTRVSTSRCSGAPAGIPGGGFLYTNAGSVSVGVVLSLPQLAASGIRPEELVADLKEHPIHRPLPARLLLREYAAHLIPEGGYDTMPALAADGMVIAGDAAAMTLAAGLWLEGVNFAIGSGFAAGQAVDRAIASGDCSASGLASYRPRSRGTVRAGRPPPSTKGTGPGSVRPGPAPLPGPDLRPGRGDVHGDQPGPEGRRAPAHPATRRPRHGVKLRELAADTLRGLRIFG